MGTVPHVAMCLVGNKCDNDARRKVSMVQGLKLAREFEIGLFFETSAVTDFNLNALLCNAILMYVMLFIIAIVIDIISLMHAPIPGHPTARSQKTGRACASQTLQPLQSRRNAAARRWVELDGTERNSCFSWF